MVAKRFANRIRNGAGIANLLPVADAECLGVGVRQGRRVKIDRQTVVPEKGILESNGVNRSLAKAYLLSAVGTKAVGPGHARGGVQIGVSRCRTVPLHGVRRAVLRGITALFHIVGRKRHGSVIGAGSGMQVNRTGGVSQFQNCVVVAIHAGLFPGGRAVELAGERSRRSHVVGVVQLPEQRQSKEKRTCRKAQAAPDGGWEIISHAPETGFGGARNRFRKNNSARVEFARIQWLRHETS